MKTAELMRKNEKLNRELMQLKKEAALFVQDVFSNPENAHLVKPQFKDVQPRQRPQKSVMFEDGWTSGKLQEQDKKQQSAANAQIQSLAAAPQVFVSQNLDFHLIDSSGRLTPLPTVLTTAPTSEQVMPNPNMAANAVPTTSFTGPSLKRKHQSGEDATPSTSGLFLSPRGGPPELKRTKLLWNGCYTLSKMPNVPLLHTYTCI